MDYDNIKKMLCSGEIKRAKHSTWRNAYIFIKTIQFDNEHACVLFHVLETNQEVMGDWEIKIEEFIDNNWEIIGCRN